MMAVQLRQGLPPVVTYCGVDHQLPFHRLLRSLHAHERSELEASVKRLGIQHPVLTFASEEYGPDCVIDGANRLSLAADLKRDVRIVDLPIDDEDVKQLALDLNECRRQLTPQELSQARRERIARVVAARGDGENLLAIAEAEEMSEKQIREDLKRSTAEGSAVDPEKVNGRDGKTRTAKPTKPRKAKPFGVLMGRVTALTTDLTRAINSEDDYGLKLEILMRVCGLVDYPNDNGSGKIPRVLPLARIHALLELAGKPGPTPTEKEIRLIYNKANGSWIPPLTEQRRARKRQR